MIVNAALSVTKHQTIAIAQAVNDAATVSETGMAIAANPIVPHNAPNGITTTIMSAGAPMTKTDQAVNPVAGAPIASLWIAETATDARIAVIAHKRTEAQ